MDRGSISHQRPGLPARQARVDVGAVAGLGQLVAEPAEGVVVDPAGAPGDLLDAADLVALPGLDDLDELAGLHQRLEGAGVEPRGAAGEHGHGEVAAPQVGVVDVGDLELAAGRWASGRGRSRRRRCRRSTGRARRSCDFGCSGFSSMREHRAVVVELDDAVALGVVDLVGEDVRRRATSVVRAQRSCRGRCRRRCCRRAPGRRASSPMKSAPMTNACARPSGLGCDGVADARCPTSRAVAEQALELRPGPAGVVMTRTSRMPASISVDSG